MHWTAFLAYRRVPANAQVIGDIRCITCGYNLRGLRAMGTCPECGHRVMDSLFVKPELVASALRGFANSYRTLFILLLGCTGTGWGYLVAAAVISAGAVFRLWSAGELRYRAHLVNTELLHSRVRLLWITSILEVVACLLWFGGILTLFNVPSLAPFIQNGTIYLVYGWFFASLINTAAADALGSALARTLGYGWMEVEFKIHRWLLVFCAITMLLPLVTLKIAVGTVTAAILIGISGLTFLITVMTLWAFIHHAANAAEQEYETWEALIDDDRIAVPTAKTAD